MKCHELAASIEALQPEADLRDVARLCLLLANVVDEHDALADESTLCRAWQETGLRLQAATDQHAAMTDELESLAEGDLRDLSREKVLVLIRAIRVQSQVLEMYVGTERASG